MSLVTVAIVNSILAAAIVAAVVHICRVPFRLERGAA